MPSAESDHGGAGGHTRPASDRPTQPVDTRRGVPMRIITEVASGRAAAVSAQGGALEAPPAVAQAQMRGTAPAVTARLAAVLSRLGAGPVTS